LVLALGWLSFVVVALVVGLGFVGWFLQCLCGWLVVVGFSLYVALFSGGIWKG
jgi:hypothetical protein